MSIAALRETRILTGRSMRHVMRSPDRIITTAITPVAMMLLFTYVFGSALGTGAPGPYINYLLPGILVITIASGVAYTSYRLFLDLRDGLVQRLRAMPISRSSVLWSHVATSLAANLLSLALVLGVAVAMGFRSSASVASWIAVLGLLCLVTLCLTWIAVLAGLSAKSVDGASAFSYPLIFLPFISSAFVPTAAMPGPVAWFAQHQPITAIADSLRALLSQDPVGSELWAALAWLAGITLLAWALAARIYRGKTTS
ncbi:ABC transporter permease [Glutamicibacter sp. ZJUTW]|uniref:ABC transporter permease n=1 Tax=Glutamicibacter sp. ZJUTW TaxID=1155384 RepID=UPI0011F352E7|nr:ABC transporter permease [Glutamicibacter sp. ZJUTW]QEP06590.1 ABC transporter permease [Glutamicibacter sp. ZJUTW]